MRSNRVNSKKVWSNINNLENQSASEQENSIAIFYKNLLKYFDLQKFLVRRQGILIDRTDDRIDPRNGIRFQYERWDSEGIGITDTVVNDYSLTFYIPSISKSNILAGNLFHSSSYVTSPLESTLKFDYAQLYC